MIVTRDKEDKNQPEFHLDDEPRCVAFSWPRCPYCSERPQLWRFPSAKGPLFQVICKVGNPTMLHLFPHCRQEPIPAKPIPDAKSAVQAWKVYCAVMKDV